MPELVFGIRATEAQRGARQFEDSTERIRRSAGRATREVDRVEGSFQRMSRTAVLLTRVMTGLVVAFVSREFVRSADTFTLINARLRLVTDGADNLATVQERLFETAQNTRTSFESVAELYARVARSSGELGRSQEELLEFTELTSQSLIVSGASATEAGAGLIQLSQGLAAGALRGDELRSVLEQLPGLARAIADGLGITIGQLRDLGAEGQLSANAVIGAVLSQGDVIREQFGQMERTVGQAFTQLQNDLLVTIGKVDDGTSATDELVEAIDGIREVVASPEFREGLTFLIEALVQIGSIVGLVISEFGALRWSFEDLADLDIGGAVSNLPIVRLGRGVAQDFGLIGPDINSGAPGFRGEGEGGTQIDITRGRRAPAPPVLGGGDDDSNPFGDLLADTEQQIALQGELNARFGETEAQLDAVRFVFEAHNLALQEGIPATAEQNQKVLELAIGLRDTATEAERLNQVQQFSTRVIAETLTPTEEYAQQIERLNEALALYNETSGRAGISTEIYRRAVEQATDELNEANNATDDLTLSIVDDLGRALASGADSWEDWGRVAVNVILEVARTLQAAQQGGGGSSGGGIIDIIGNAFSFVSGLFGGGGGLNVGGGSGSIFGSQALSLTGGGSSVFFSGFGGPRASGGRVMPGRTFLVGEEGPEPFIPDVPGTILPTGSQVGGNTVIIDLRGSNGSEEIDRRVRRALELAGPELQESAVRTVQDRRLRDDLFFGGGGRV